MERPHIAAALLLAAASLTCGAAQPATGPAAAREIRGNLVLEGVPAHSPRVLATLDGWLAGRSASFRDFLPDGSLLISTRFGDTEQVHRVAQPGGAREQLTFDIEPVGAVSANPAPGARGFLFSRDRGGNENAQLYLHDLDTRQSRRLTDGKSRHGGAV